MRPTSAAGVLPSGKARRTAPVTSGERDGSHHRQYVKLQVWTRQSAVRWVTLDTLARNPREMASRERLTSATAETARPRLMGEGGYRPVARVVDLHYDRRSLCLTIGCVRAPHLSEHASCIVGEDRLEVGEDPLLGAGASVSPSQVIQYATVSAEQNQDLPRQRRSRFSLTWPRSGPCSVVSTWRWPCSGDARSCLGGSP